MQDLNWNDLRFVLAVARTESLAGAARQLGVNETTVARRIAQVEQQLDVRLFERIRGVLYPTQSGAIIVSGAERVELEIQAIGNTVSGANQLVAGKVRLTSVPIIVNHLLIPALPRLFHDQPQLQLELIAEPRDLSLTKRETDIALRLARPNKEMGVVARRIGQLNYAVYGRTGKNADPLPWITYEDNMANLPQARWLANNINRTQETIASVMVNDAEAILECLKAGFGKSLLPIAIGECDPDLIRLDDGPAPLSRELWLIVHPELRKLTRIRVVMDWLVATVAQLQ